MASREYLRVVAEMNHHIRNALDVIQMAAAATGQQGAIQVQVITESVARIDWALRELLRESLPAPSPSGEVAKLSGARTEGVDTRNRRI